MFNLSFRERFISTLNCNNFLAKMRSFDWKKTIKINIITLQAVGFWPKGDDSFKFNLYGLWTAISFTCIIFCHNFFQAVSIYFILNDLKAVTAVIFLNLSELLGILKSYYLIKNMPKLKQLMITLNKPLFQPKNERQIKLIEPNLKFWKQMYNLYWVMSSGALFFWATFPIFDNSIKDHRLPFIAWFPFDTTVSPFYEIAYVHQVVGIIFVAISTVGVDTLIAALSMYIGAQIDLLCDNLRHLTGPNFNNELLNCIHHHKTILRFANNSNEFFNWIAFFQFFISATSIGITLFQMTVVTPFTSEYFSLISFELAIVVEIFMYCWFGNEIEEKSKIFLMLLLNPIGWKHPRKARRI
nr:PREDICTED: putative odorant receptor 71a isoform X3 [Tribolium castaneum]|eukprot:XP_015838103.1 PREDICTED: putative odorant receptor 71a isoform X3 [Tribolium castaneum]